MDLAEIAGTEEIVKALETAGRKVFALRVRRMDRELDIVHEALTELYNIDAAVPIIKSALARIDALSGCDTSQTNRHRK